VAHQKVRFYNRLGIEVAADMYLPGDLDRSLKSAAVIVGHPFTGVKEQTAGLYAMRMAENGFISLAFDFSFGGESGGQPRNIASPEAYVEDFSAAVDFIGTRPFVDRGNIGVLDICGSGGFAINAAAVDPRMKAVVTVSMADMDDSRRNGLGATPEARQKALEKIAAQRYVEFEGGQRLYTISVPETYDDAWPDVLQEFYDYYRTHRGEHYRCLTAVTLTSDMALVNFFPFALIDTISPRPILFIAGEKAYSRPVSERAYKLAAEPKELMIIPKATHVDLYDGGKSNFIPLGKIVSLFKENLKCMKSIIFGGVHNFSTLRGANKFR
jgi:hypothetical protein